MEKEFLEVAPLWDVVKVRSPDPVEIRAVGSVLQTFYNGIESILSILLEIKGQTESSWHKKLLENALNKGIISEELFEKLDPYRRFRHKFRHSYGFTLTWDMMSPLMLELEDVFKKARSELSEK